MKIIRHYLSKENDQVRCPLNRDSACNNTCAWFDNEEQDCRMIGGFWKIREELVDLKEAIITCFYKKKEFMELRDID